MKCRKCNSNNHKSENCPFILEKGEKPHYVWWNDPLRPIEKADKYLLESGLEKDGAKGWI